MSRKCVYEWFKLFREGTETTEDEPRSGRPSTSRTPEMIEKVRQMLATDAKIYCGGLGHYGYGAHYRPR